MIKINRKEEVKIMIDISKKRGLILLLVLILLLILSACTIPKRFVGLKVDYRDPIFCECYNLPATCTTKTGDFRFEFELSESNVSGEYIIKGGATFVGTGAPRRLNKAESRFFLLNASNGVIIDNLSLNVAGSDPSARLPFKKTFKCEPFDAVGIGYQVTFVD